MRYNIRCNYFIFLFLYFEGGSYEQKKSKFLSQGAYSVRSRHSTGLEQKQGIFI
jgi:hypothetical protein